MVWPKSHRSLHVLTRTDGCLYENMASPELLEGFHAGNRIEPVIIPVEAGDVIFLHYRLLHGPSLNLRVNHVRLADYFNICKSEDATGPVGGLWDGWDGVEALGLPAYEETNRTPRPIPTPKEWSDFRRHLPEGGAHISYANFLTRWVNRLQREAQAAAKPFSLDWWYHLQNNLGLPLIRAEAKQNPQGDLLFLTSFFPIAILRKDAGLSDGWPRSCGLTGFRSGGITVSMRGKATATRSLGRLAKRRL